MNDVKPALVHRNLPLLLLLAREAVIGHFRPVLKAHGVTEQQWRVLRVLVQNGALEPRQIVTLCGISSPSLAGMLARMEEQGLIAREGLAHDKRRQLVHATARSRRLASRMAPKIEAVYAALEQRLGSATVQRMYEVMDELLAALGAMQPGPPDTEQAQDTAGD